MEIKINCLRNGIEGGGASTESSNLLDGYGTYLYDLYKPSGEDMAAHPELADEPLGIVYPTGNVLFKSIKTTTATATYAPYESNLFEYSDNNKETIKKEPTARYACTYFHPSLYRELTENKTIGDINSQIKYIMNSHPLYNGYDGYLGHFYYPVLNDEPIDIQSFANDKSSINKVSLLPARHISTDIKNYMHDRINVDIWNNTTDNYDDATLKNTIYTAFFPIFEFFRSSDNYRWSLTNNQVFCFVSNKYNSFFSKEELSKINNDDLEYYKKSAVLIYKKDLMDFKNFFKTIMDYNMEINTYIQSLRSPKS